MSTAQEKKENVEGIKIELLPATAGAVDNAKIEKKVRMRGELVVSKRVRCFQPTAGCGWTF